MKNKILVINDSESIRQILQYYLEKKNYDVYLAKDGLEGIQKTKDISPDLILLDVMMPGLTGFEVCRKLKNDPKTESCPIIFLSSLTDTSDKIQGLESGGVDFITNTADQAEVEARIETHLKIQELTRELKASNQELMFKQKALNADLQAAGVIQQSLLPNKIPDIPNIKLAWTCHPSTLVGGDICSISLIEPDQLNCYILDVSGHGVPSAMVTVSITQYLGQKELTTASSPKHVLTLLNKEYPFEKFNMFSTIFYMTLNPKNGKLIFSNAGHPEGILLHSKKKLELLPVTGSLIGVDPNSVFDDKVIQLEKGDKVFIYTDGVIEYRNSKGEFYGTDRLYALLEKIKHHSIHEILHLVFESILEFGDGRPTQDDVSLLGLEYFT